MDTEAGRQGIKAGAEAKSKGTGKEADARCQTVACDAGARWWSTLPEGRE